VAAKVATGTIPPARSSQGGGSSPQIIVNGAEKLLEKVRPSVIGYEKYRVNATSDQGEFWDSS
jgi:hypothetical protein